MIGRSCRWESTEGYDWLTDVAELKSILHPHPLFISSSVRAQPDQYRPRGLILASSKKYLWTVIDYPHVFILSLFIFTSVWQRFNCIDSSFCLIRRHILIPKWLIQKHEPATLGR